MCDNIHLSDVLKIFHCGVESVYFPLSILSNNRLLEADIEGQKEANKSSFFLELSLFKVFFLVS